MDDKQLKDATARLRKIEAAIGDLNTKLRRTESQLANEHDLIRKSVSQRAVLVGDLVGASTEESRRLHEKIDGLDAQIKGSERMAESYQRLLQTTKDELAAVTVECDRANQIVGQEQNARAFQAWQDEMEKHFAAAREAMANAREALGRLTTTAARGGEVFAGPAHTWAAGRFDEFEHRQANPELLGFRQSLPWYRSIIVHVSPMSRG